MAGYVGGCVQDHLHDIAVHEYAWLEGLKGVGMTWEELAELFSRIPSGGDSQEPDDYLDGRYSPLALSSAVLIPQEFRHHSNSPHDIAPSSRPTSFWDSHLQDREYFADPVAFYKKGEDLDYFLAEHFHDLWNITTSANAIMNNPRVISPP